MKDSGECPKETLIRHEADLAVLKALLNEKCKSVEERMDLKFDASDRALNLQFTEFMRRLHELNGHHEELKQSQSISVTRDKFDDLVKGDIASLKSFRDASLGRQSVIAVIISAVIALAIKYLLP